MPILPESTILTPRDPKLEDDNDWEQFQLTNVEVRNTTTNELSSVLLADANNPLYITGRLKNVEPEQAHLCKHMHVLFSLLMMALAIVILCFEVNG